MTMMVMMVTINYDNDGLFTQRSLGDRMLSEPQPLSARADFEDFAAT